MLQKLIILNNENAISLKNKELTLVKFKRPRSKELVPFLMTETKDTITFYELMSYTQDLASVFIDDHIQSESAVYLGAKFNLNYVLIEYVASLSVAASKFDSFEAFKRSVLVHLFRDTLSGDEFERLLKKLNIEKTSLTKLFDVTSIGNKTEKFKIEFNKEKCVSWLKSKVELLKLKMDEMAMAVATKQTTKLQQANLEKEEAKIRMDAFELVCQYLTGELCDLLRKEMGLSAPLNTSNENKKPKQQLVGSE